MIRIEVSKVPVYISLLWSYILCFIPTIIIALKVKNAKYEYDENQIIIEKGILKIQQDAINLQFVLDVQGSSNIFKYGTVTLRTRLKTITLEYVKNPTEVARILRNITLDYDKNAKIFKNV